MSAHTPGPFGVPPWATGISIDGGPVIPMPLIATAPRMLALLKYMMCPADEDRLREWRTEASAILRDVEGVKGMIYSNHSTR